MPGTWRVQHVRQPQLPAFTGNLIQRAALIAGLTGWQELIFLPPAHGVAILELRSHNTVSQLDYHIEDNLLAIGSADPRLSHEHWEADYMGGVLYLRSLADGEVLDLTKVSSAGRQAATRLGEARPLRQP